MFIGNAMTIFILLISVKCENPDQYLDDYDICDSLEVSDCLTEDINTKQILHEFCPALCRCSEWFF